MYKILSKLVDECWRYSKPNQCHFWAWLKRPIFGVLDSHGSAETLVRRGGITNYHLIACSIFIQQYLCQKLSKSVDVHWSYSVERHCRFFLRHSVDAKWLLGWKIWKNVSEFNSCREFNPNSGKCPGRILCQGKLFVRNFVFETMILLQALYMLGFESTSRCRCLGKSRHSESLDRWKWWQQLAQGSASWEAYFVSPVCQ